MTAEIAPKPNVEISINPVTDKLKIELDVTDFFEAPDDAWISLRTNIKDHLIDKKIIEVVKNEEVKND